jgi:hypothetical protein
MKEYEGNQHGDYQEFSLFSLGISEYHSDMVDIDLMPFLPQHAMLLYIPPSGSPSSVCPPWTCSCFFSHLSLPPYNTEFMCMVLYDKAATGTKLS